MVETSVAILKLCHLFDENKKRLQEDESKKNPQQFNFAYANDLMLQGARNFADTNTILMNTNGSQFEWVT